MTGSLNPVDRLHAELRWRRAASFSHLTLERHVAGTDSVYVAMNPINHILELEISPALLSRPEDLELELLKAANDAVDTVRDAYPDGVPAVTDWCMPLLDPDR